MSDTRLRRDVLWNLVPVVMLAVVGLGLNFMIAKWWGPAALGVFNLVTIALFAFAVIGACGIQFSVLRSVAEVPDDRERVAAVSLGALIPGIACAAAALGLFMLARGPISRLHGSAAVAEGMLWAAPGLFCFAINKILFGICNGLRRMRAFAIYTSLRYSLIAVGLVLARVLDLDHDHLPVIWTFAEGVLLLVLIGELLATVSLTRGAGWRTWARAHMVYGARGVTATLAQELFSKMDVWMLGAANISKDLVGVYSLASGLFEGAVQLPTVVQNNLNPVIAHSLAENKPTEVEELVRRTRRWFVPTMAGACVLGAVAFPLLMPRLLADQTFAAGTAPFAILMAGLALSSPYLAFNQILLMANKPGWYTVFLVLVVAVSFVGNLLLIPPLGLAGAATSTSVAVIASAILVRVLARRRVGVQI